MKTNPGYLRIGFAVLALTASASAGLIVTLNPSADTFVSAANAGRNYGAAGALGVAAAGLPKGEFDSLLRFNLASAKTAFDASFGAGMWALDSMSLQLTSTTPGNPIFNSPSAAGQFSMKWMSDDSWIEGNGSPQALNNIPGAITFSSLASYLSGSDQALGTYSFPGGTSGNNTWNLALASSFEADAAAGNLVSLLMAPADSSVAYLADSANFGTASFRPFLTVSASALPAVPEPASTSLLVSAGLAAIAWRRRHARRA